MKKLLCFVLTLAMVLSMMPSVFAAELPSDAKEVTSVTDGSTTSFGTGLTEDDFIPGTAGKDAEDLGFNLSTTNSGKYTNLGAPARIHTYIDYNKTDGLVEYSSNEFGYFVFQFNIKPNKTANGTGFRWAGMGGKDYSMPVTAASLKQGEWNKVAIVIDFTEIDHTHLNNNDNMAKLIKDSAIADFNAAGKSTIPAADGSYYEKEAYTADFIKKIVPKATTYINGELYNDNFYVNRLRDAIGIGYPHFYATQADDWSAALEDNNGQQSRFFLTGDMNADFDDVYTYYINTQPDGIALTALPTLAAGENYTVSGKELKATAPISLDAVKAANPSCTISAYADSTCEAKLSDTALLMPGNAVVVSNPVNDAIDIYTVEKNVLVNQDGSSPSFLLRNDPTNSSAGTKTYTNDEMGKKGNYYGKQYADSIVNLYVNSSGATDKTYMYISAANVNSIAQDGTHNYNYYVIEFDYREYKNTNTGFVFKGPNNGNLTNTISGDIFPQNDWGKVAIVVDYSKVDTTYETDKLLAETENGVAMGSTIENFDKTKVVPEVKTYVNGVLVDTCYAENIKDRFGMYNTYYDGELKPNVSGADLRLFLTEGCYGSFDNFSVYQTNIAIDGVARTKLPVIGGGNVIADGMAASQGTATVAAYGQTPLTAAYIEKESGYDIAAYGDLKLNAQLDADTELVAGNYIIAKDKYTGTAKVFVVADTTQSDTSYNLKDTVTIKNIEPPTNSSGKLGRFTLSKNMKASLATGVNGKASSDVSIKIAKNQTDNPYISNGALASVDSNGNITYGYYVLKFNFMPITENTTYTFAGPNGGTVCNGVATRYFKSNEWNSVLIYVDYTNIDTTHFADKLLAESLSLATAGSKQVMGSTITDEDFDITKVAPAGYVFINGVQVGGAAYPNRLQDRFGMPSQYYHPTSKELSTGTGLDFRLGFNTENASPEAYIDDLYIYQTNVRPDGVALTALPEITATTDNATVVDNKLVAKAGAALADLTTNADSVVAYDANATATDFVSGTLLSLVGENNAINTYKVSGFKADTTGATATDVLAGDTIIIAEYDSNDNLVNCAMNIAEADGNVTATFETPVTAGNTVRAYLLDDMATIKPLSTPIVVQYSN